MSLSSLVNMFKTLIWILLSLLITIWLFAKTGILVKALDQNLNWNINSWAIIVNSTGQVVVWTMASWDNNLSRTWEIISWASIASSLQTIKYSIDSNIPINFWLTFMWILSTVFAVFFVYSWFKIDTTVQIVENAEKRMLKLEQIAQEDMEYYNQLNYSIQYMVSKEYQKAIDALTVLRNQHFTLKDSYKLNSCLYFLAVCYYELGSNDNNIEDVSKAVQYINEAIEDPQHPLKVEILAKFKEMDIAENPPDEATIS